VPASPPLRAIPDHESADQERRAPTGTARAAKDMLVCMRTTINLPDALAEAAKAKAAAEGRTFTSVVEEGLRAMLAAEPKDPPIVLPAYGRPDGTVLVDISDRDALWAALDADGRR
jgi:plasmid stability protein